VKGRTARARGSANGAGIEDLLGRTQDFLGDLVVDLLRRPIEGLVKRILGQVARHGVAAALLGLGAAFLLWAAADGLIALGAPAYAAHAAAGVLSIAAAWFVVQGCGGSGDRR
jgi:hypothetical protein